MEEINQSKTKGLFLGFFIFLALLILSLHLVIQLMESDQAYENNKSQQQMDYAEPEIQDSIWENTEFIPD